MIDAAFICGDARGAAALCFGSKKAQDADVIEIIGPYCFSSFVGFHNGLLRNI